MAQVLVEGEEREEHGPKIGAQMRSVLILFLGFVGGIVAVACHFSLLLWGLPLLNIELPYEDILVTLFPLVWWVSAIFTMGRAMRWIRRYK